MGKRRLPDIVVFVAVLGLVFWPACKKKKSPAPVAATVEIQGDLNIVHVSPEGPTLAAEEAQEILVVFDHPMAALEALPKKESAPLLRIDPPAAGRSRWMGTKTLAFKPSNRLPFATKFTVTIPSGTRSIDNYVLRRDYTWIFETIRPRLILHEPKDREKQQKLETSVLLVFNQAVGEKKVREFISLTGFGPLGEQETLGFSLDRTSGEKLRDLEILDHPDYALLLKPARNLKPGLIYAVELKSGLQGQEGPLGMEKGVVFRFATFLPFEFLGASAGPNRDPQEPVQFRFSNRVVYKEFIKKVHFDPKVEIPDYYGEWDHANETLWLSLPLAPETAYAVRLDPDLQDEFGNALGREAVGHFVTAPFKPSIRMATGHGVLEAYEGLSFPLFVLNASQARLRASRLSKDEIIPILTKDKVFWADEEFNPRPDFYSVDRSLSFNLPRNKRQTVPLELEGILASHHGFLFVELDTFSEDKWNRYPKAFLQATELGLSGKFSPDHNVIWVTELRSGAPVAGAEIEIRDDENSVRWKGRTDREGKAETPGWRSLGIRKKDEWTKPRQWVFAARGDDVAFTSSEWGTGIDAYRFGIPYDWNPEPERIRGYIFTERGIYRAGETVHIQGILREADKGRWVVPKIEDVRCEILDPFQTTVSTKKASLDAFGTFSQDFESREDAPLGQYQIAVVVPPETPAEKEAKFIETFRVEAYRPAEFEVHLRSQKEEYVFSDSFEAEIRATYLYGGAMADQPARWSLRLNPSSFTPPGHEGFIFGDELEAWSEGEELAEGSRLVASGEGTLGPDGRLHIKAPLVPEKEKSTASATLEATVESPSRHSVSNRIQAVVHQGEFYIGLKPATTFVKKGEKVSALVITAAPDGSLSPEKRVEAKLIKREWHSARKAGVGGRFQWMSESVDTEIESRTLRTKNDPVEVFFTPEKSGLYLLAADSQDHRKNRIRTAAYVYVTGKDYVPWQRRNDDTLELAADKNNYKPGDRARVLVKSPYERAKALVTVEREFVLQSRVEDILGSTSEIEIPLTRDDIPNVFVSVLLVQGRTSEPANSEIEDIGKPSFKIGYVELHVDPSEKRLNVDVAADQITYKPKNPVTVRITVKNAAGSGIVASLAVAVVDVGVLNLIGHRTPDPFSGFYGQRPLSVDTSETRLHVVDQRNYGEKGENAGGGQGAFAAEARAPAELELRADFRSTAYWNPSVLTDQSGQAVVRFKLPDNLTTFRIMAVAQTKDSLFGRGETHVKVAKPLLLLPSLPRFARVGDRFLAGVVIHNDLTAGGTAMLTLKARGVSLAGAVDRHEVRLEAGERREVLFSFEAEKPGRAVFEFQARMGQQADGLEMAIPIEMARPTETVATFDETAEAQEQEVHIPESVYPGESRLEIQAAASALAGLGGSVDYVTNYPYQCLEQKLSGILPYLVAPEVIREFKLSALSSTEIAARIRTAIREIYACQKDSGGFGLWPDAPFESPFISCYAVFALLNARATGFDVAQGPLASGLNYLKNLLPVRPQTSTPYDQKSWLTTKAFALYVLALAGRPEPAYAEIFFRERDRLSLFGRAYLLKALHLGNGSLEAQNLLFRELMNKVRLVSSLAYFEEDDERKLGWIYSSSTRTTAVILQTLLEIGSDDPLLPAAARWLVQKRKAGCWSSTQENFFVFYALNDFYQKYEKVKPNFRAEISLAKRTILRETFQDSSQTAAASLPLGEFKPSAELALHVGKTGPGILYYGARLIYAPREMLEPRDEGFAVYKTLEALDGRPLAEVQAGSLAAVKLEIIVPKESLFVVVEDPLPAGLEAVSPTFLTESREAALKLERLDKAENRPWWQGFHHVEMHDDRVLLFADSLLPGIHTYRYLVRALTFGQFGAPGTKVLEMYAPEVFGRGAEQSLKVVR
jgi:uncharacterized protein YfaS (alpha-2-macroglobulin family)